MDGAGGERVVGCEGVCVWWGIVISREVSWGRGEEVKGREGCWGCRVVLVGVRGQAMRVQGAVFQ